MARKPRTFTTSAGFFDLAVAAPSMKAALEAWGATANLFHQGFARATEDLAIVKATTAKPGVVLRRPVGTSGPFGEHADLPADLTVAKARNKSAGTAPSRSTPHVRAQQRQEREAERERKRRRAAIAKAEATLAQARQTYNSGRAKIDTDRVALDQRAEAEEARWRRDRERLESTLRQARMGKLRVV